MSQKRLVLVLVSVVAVMLGLAYASVPLYRLFCQVTGFGGTPKIQQVGANGSVIDYREIEIRFNADVHPGLDWEFKPTNTKITIKPGERKLTFYRATNRSDRPIIGVSTYNVTPNKMGQYFVKVECFCFQKQILKPGQTMDFPLIFYIDPEMVYDKNLDDIKTITLSYTFFEAKDGDPLPQRQ